MKKILLSMFIIPFVLACSMTGNETEKNLQLIGNYVLAVENMDFDAMETYLANDYIGIGPSFGDSIKREQAIANWKDNVENLYERIKYKRSRNIAVTIDSGPNQGHWVSNWAELEIVYKDGKGEVTILANTIYQIEEGRITKSLTFYNEADALRQLGYVFIHPNDL